MRDLLRRFTIGLIAPGVSVVPASAQSIKDFVIAPPVPAIELVQVVPFSPNPRLTFRNTSSKTILEICISPERDPKGMGETECQSGSASDAKLPGPGDTFTMYFDTRSFASHARKTVTVNGVVYTDGSHFGNKRTLATIAGRMTGYAMEAKRVAELLANGADQSAAGLDSVLLQIGTTPPSRGEAVAKLKGQMLPGISPLVVKRYMNSPMSGWLEGVGVARDAVIHDINEKKALAQSPLPGGANRRRMVLGARSHGRSDLAQEYQGRCQSDVHYLAAFLRAGDTVAMQNHE